MYVMTLMILVVFRSKFQVHLTRDGFHNGDLGTVVTWSLIIANYVYITLVSFKMLRLLDTAIAAFPDFWVRFRGVSDLCSHSERDSVCSQKHSFLISWWNPPPKILNILSEVVKQLLGALQSFRIQRVVSVCLSVCRILKFWACNAIDKTNIHLIENTWNE